MADWLFNGDTRVIKEPPGAGDTVWQVDRDIYSAWKRWVETGAGAVYPEAFIVEGGTPIGATGIFTGVSQILTNGWKLMTADHDHQALVAGNLYSDDGVVSVPNPVGQSTIVLSQSAAAQGISSGSGLSGAQEAQLNTLEARIERLYRFRGLDPANPWTIRPGEELSGPDRLTIVGDGVNQTVVQADP